MHGDARDHDYHRGHVHGDVHARGHHHVHVHVRVPVLQAGQH